MRGWEERQEVTSWGAILREGCHTTLHYTLQHTQSAFDRWECHIINSCFLLSLSMNSDFSLSKRSLKRSLNITITSSFSSHLCTPSTSTMFIATRLLSSSFCPICILTFFGVRFEGSGVRVCVWGGVWVLKVCCNGCVLRIQKGGRWVRGAEEELVSLEVRVEEIRLRIWGIGNRMEGWKYEGDGAKEGWKYEGDGAREGWK